MIRNRGSGFSKIQRLEKLKKDSGLNDEEALDRFALLALNLNEFIYLD